MNRVLIAGVAALALVACNKKNDTATTSDTAAANSQAATPTSDAVAPAVAPAVGAAPAAREFVAMAAASDMYEVRAAKIAEKKSKNADVKAFAAMMVTDHGKSTAMIKKAVADSGRKDITPPAELPTDKQSLIDALSMASASDFDKTYVDQQLTAHKTALALMQSYAGAGDVPQLKDAAGKIVPVVQGHLDHITMIQSGLGK
jgi:putative membrane protein